MRPGDVECATCGAPIGKPCLTEAGTKTGPHADRVGRRITAERRLAAAGVGDIEAARARRQERAALAKGLAARHR